MIVCLCKGLSDRKILEHVDRGARTLQALGLATGAGTDCGGCRGALRGLLDERRACEADRLPLPLAAK